MLLGSSIYTNSIDVWALACVMIELITKKEIFKGSSTLDCLLNISRVIGSKDLKRLKGNEQLTKLLPVIKGLALSEYLHEIGCPLLIDLLTKMLKIKSEERIRAIEILAHPFFDEIRDEQIYQEIMKEKLDISDFFTFSPSNAYPI
jgi:glycogen synthase kinase 3 beta